MTIINVKKLSKTMQKTTILNNINLDFEGGKIYGLYGINGSGKTMLLRALAGIIIANEGQIIIDGQQLHKDISFPPKMGLIIENTSMLEAYSAKTNLKMLASIQKTASEEDIHLALTRVGLDPTSKLKVKKYSLGMKQRLSIAQAIFEKPNILLLDEPTNALDTDGIELFHQILLEEKARGALIIIASHNKEDINLLSDSKLKMQNGVLTVEEK